MAWCRLVPAVFGRRRRGSQEGLPTMAADARQRFKTTFPPLPDRSGVRGAQVCAVRLPDRWCGWQHKKLFASGSSIIVIYGFATE